MYVRFLTSRNRHKNGPVPSGPDDTVLGAPGPPLRRIFWDYLIIQKTNKKLFVYNNENEEKKTHTRNRRNSEPPSRRIFAAYFYLFCHQRCTPVTGALSRLRAVFWRPFNFTEKKLFRKTKTKKIECC